VTVELLERRALMAVAPAADTTPPTVVSVHYVDEPLQEITVRFSEWLDRSIDASDMRLKNLDTGQGAAPLYNVFTSVNPPTPTSATWQVVGRLPAGRYQGTIPAGSVSDTSGNVLADDYTFEFSTKATVSVRRPFYNNSVFDGNRPAADNDDRRAWPDRKYCLLPGEQATVDNVSNYSKGINGLLLQMAGLPAGRTPGVADMSFAVATGRNPTDWAAAPAPSGLLIVHQPSVYGDTDLIHLVWPDGAIRNCWLRVTVKANENTQLARDDISYFGNLVGETFDRPGIYNVDFLDLRRTQSGYNPRLYSNSITSSYDHNHDSRVNVLDVVAVRANVGGGIAPAPPGATVPNFQAAALPAAAPARPISGAPKDRRMAYEVL
jgi:hypothetical protein